MLFFCSYIFLRGVGTELKWIVPFWITPKTKYLQIEQAKQFQKKNVFTFFFVGISWTELCLAAWGLQSLQLKSMNQTLIAPEQQQKQQKGIELNVIYHSKFNLRKKNRFPISIYRIQVHFMRAQFILSFSRYVYIMRENTWNAWQTKTKWRQQKNGAANKKRGLWKTRKSGWK